MHSDVVDECLSVHHGCLGVDTGAGDSVCCEGQEAQVIDLVGTIVLIVLSCVSIVVRLMIVRRERHNHERQQMDRISSGSG